MWHVHSQNEADARCDPDRGSPIATKKAFAVRSPVSTLRLPKRNGTKLCPIQEPDINVTAATPPTEQATLPDEADQHDTLWLAGPGQTDMRNFVSSAPSTPGIQDEDRGGPNDESWHSREPTRVHGARPDSGVGGLEVECQNGPATKTELPTIKSEVSLAAGITSGVNVSASIGAAGETTNEKKPNAGIMGWLRSRLPKKTSTQMSGAAQFEEIWEEQHSDDGKKEATTDVLEVWFAGCHSGKFSLFSCHR